MEWLESLQKLLPPVFISMIISAGIGLIIGLEREFNHQDEPGHVGGIRTFIMAALLGNVCDWLAQQSNPQLLLVAVTGFFLLISVAYFVQAQKGKMGLTTEFALLLTFLLGIANSRGFTQESLALVVLMTVVLSLKDQLHSFIKQITEEELFAFIKFIVLALLILPILPTEPFGPDDAFHPRELGYIIVMVLSINFAGYLLLKFGSPKKGILLSAIIGGLFSSTMIAWVFSARSREQEKLASAFGAGIVLASSIMFIRVFIWVAIFDFPAALKLLLPLSIMFLISLFPAWQVYRKKTGGKENIPLDPGNPLDVKNALIFLLLYVGITLLMLASRNWLNPALTYLSAAIAGIADSDAITISTAKWASDSEQRTLEAARIVLIAVMSNSLFKWLISLFKGAPGLRPQVNLSFGLVLLAGVGWLIFWMF